LEWKEVFPIGSGQRHMTDWCEEAGEMIGNILVDEDVFRKVLIVGKSGFLLCSETEC
jgi:hypothetical protein